MNTREIQKTRALDNCFLYFSVKAVYNCLTKCGGRLDIQDKNRPMMPTGNTLVELKENRTIRTPLCNRPSGIFILARFSGKKLVRLSF